MGIKIKKSKSKEQEKIPIRIVKIKNQNNKDEIEVLVGINDFFDTDSSIREEIAKFKKSYLELIKEAKKLKNEYQKNRPKNVLIYWKLSNLLNNFISGIESKFTCDNLPKSLERDIEWTDSNVDVLLRFARNFKKDELNENISWSYYWEIMLKKNQLESINEFEAEKRHLLNANLKELGGHKEYRKALSEKIQKRSIKKK